MDKLQIQSRNDAFRTNLPYSITPRNILIFSRGIYAEFNSKQIEDILTAVCEFNTFNEGNDPHGEHDFGSFVYAGRKIFWKIDDYHGEDDMDIILTVMLAEEY